MKLNPLFINYFKVSFLCILFSLIFTFSFIISSEQKLKKEVDSAREYYNLKDKNIEDDEIIYNFKYRVFKEDGTVEPNIMQAFVNEYSYIKDIIPIAVIGICSVFVLYLYFDDRNRKTISFINHIPIKREKLFFYKWINGIFIILFVYGLTYIFLNLNFSKYVPTVIEFNSKLTGDYDFGNIKNGWWHREIDKILLDSLCLCFLVYSFFHFIQNIIGKPVIAYILFFISIMLFIESLKGIRDFITYYQIQMFDEEYLYKTYEEFIKIFYNNYVKIFLTAIISFLSVLLYKKADVSRSGTIFMFKNIKYFVVILSFIFIGPLIFRILDNYDILYNFNMITSIFIMIFFSIIGSVFVNKIISLNE